MDNSGVQTLEKPEKAPASASTRRRVTDLAVTGMTCGNCARHVTEAIQGVAGVHSATVSLDAHQATVRWQTDARVDPAAVVRAVEEAGYGAKVTEASEMVSGHSRVSGWRLNLLVGLPITLFLMAGEWLFIGWLQRRGLIQHYQWLAFGLALVVQVVAGARFYRGAWGQLKAGSSNMDTLVALGSTTAFGYSTWALLTGTGGHMYFMEAAAIITLISAGHWLEARVSAHASSALQQLLNLAPAQARLRQPDGTERDVPVAELQTGEIVSLRPGDRVPTDGQVIEGDSAVDESMLTGESVPVDKKTGAQVYAGTVNINGRLGVRVTATGEETALAHVIAAVQRAQTSRANIQRLGDRVSSVFVPLVCAVALAAGLWWAFAPDSAARLHTWAGQFLWHVHTPSGVAAGFIVAAAVLIVACPCAMGLATPAAIMAGSNAAAQRGILIRDGVALEKAGKVTAVMFDKTGTLTTGKPAVAGVWHNPDETSESAATGWAAGLARNSTHPISQSIAALAKDEVRVTDWHEVRGAGVQARKLAGPPEPKSGAGVLRLGSTRWLAETGTDLSAGAEFERQWSTQGATVVGLAEDNRLLALFAVKDTLKPGARAVVDRLRAQGLRVLLVTGDNRLTANSIAQQAGLDAADVFAEVRPENKAELVQRLQSEGQRVAFVGDGINDAPALEQADLGIAVSRASDIAREAADIILLRSEIEAVPESLGLARATLRTIKQNLFWAFFYNAVGVPLAALGFMSPVLCAAAMGLSDIIVIGNALRLRAWRFSAPRQNRS